MCGDRLDDQERWNLAYIAGWLERLSLPPQVALVGPAAPPRHADTPEPAAGNSGPTRVHLRDRLLTLDDLATLPPVEPLIDGLLYRRTLAQLSGPAGVYKSFMTVGMAVSVASGESFGEHRVPAEAAGPVVYVAAEGAEGLLARIYAACEWADVDPAELKDRLFVLREPIQLGNVIDITEAVETMRDVDGRLLVIDTRARCTVGLEENSATEQGKAITRVDGLIAATGATVLPVHHSARNGVAGRGSNAWDGAVWSDLRMSGEALSAEIECAKHKDAPDGCKHVFRMIPHIVSPELMPGATERQRSTLVAAMIEDDPRGEERPTEASDAALRTARTWWRLHGDGWVTRTAVIDSEIVSKATFYRHVSELRATGWVEVKGETRKLYRITRRPS